MTPTPQSPVPQANPVPAHVVRVTVVADTVEVDLTVPASVPLVSVLPAIVAVVDRHHRPGVGDGARPSVLAGPSGAPLDGARSLTENGIRDGDLLLLHDADAVLPTPLFDDVPFAVAASTREPEFTAEWARRLGGAVAVAASTSAAALIAWRTPDHLAVAAGTLIVAAALVAVGLRARTLAPIVAAAPLLAASGTAFVPGRGAPDILLAAAFVAAGALVAGALARHWRSTLTGLACGAGVVALAALWSTLVTGSGPGGSGRDVAAAAAGLGIALLTVAPRLALAQARLAVPEADGPDFTTPDHDRTYAVVRARTARAQQYLTGWVGGLSAAIALGAVVAATPSDAAVSVPATAYALVVATVLALRGRIHVDRARAITQIGAGAVCAVAVFVCIGIGAPDRAPVAIAGVGVTVAIALATGLGSSARRWTPVQRRAGDIAEYVLIAALVPLLVWTLDLFATVRGL